MNSKNNMINFGTGSVSIETFEIAFDAIYDDLYDNDNSFCATSFIAGLFESQLHTDMRYNDAATEFVKFRGDLLTSDRELAAFHIAYSSFAEGVLPCVAGIAIQKNFAA